MLRQLGIHQLKVILPIAFARGYVCVLPPLHVAFHAAAHHSHCSIAIATHHIEGTSNLHKLNVHYITLWPCEGI